MKKTCLFLVLTLIVTLVIAYEPFYVDDPSISPDGEKVAFIYMGNIWEVAYQGGVARRLTASNDRISRPAYSPCGNWILFHSDRDGTQKIYRLPTSGGVAELITNERITFTDWYPDGTAFLATLGPGEGSVYVKHELGKERPVEISPLAGGFGTISDDGKKIVFDRRGLAFRPAYQGSVNGDLWLYDIDSTEFTRLTDTPLTERYPKFSRVQKDRIYYAASDSLNFQLFYMDNFDDSTRKQLTFLPDWSVRDIAVSLNTDRIVFEYFKEIWTYDPTTNVTRKIDIEILEDNFVDPFVHSKFEGEISDFAVSQNQELIVFSHKFDLFAVPVSGGNVVQLTFDQRGIEDIVIMNDNETIYFISNVQGIPKLFNLNIKEAINNTPTPRFIEWSNDKYLSSIWLNPQGELETWYDLLSDGMIPRTDGVSPSTVSAISDRHRTDGGTPSIRDRNLIAQMDKNGNFQQLFPEEYVSSYVVGSNKTIYTSTDIAKWVTTLKIKDNVTTKDIYITSRNPQRLTLSEDETQLIFRYNGNINIVSLVNEWKESENNWDKIVTPNPSRDIKNPAVTGIWDITSENFDLRNRILVSESGWLNPIFTTKDSTLYYLNTSANNTTLKSIKFDGKKKEDVFNFRGSVNEFSLSDDNSTMFYMVNNKLHKLNIKSKQSTPITFDYRYTYNIETLNKDVFEHVWGRFGHHFYDPDMHGQNWEEIYNTFEPLMTGIRDVTILERFVEEMIGRVNASHTGFTPRREGVRRDFTTTFAGIVLDYRSRLPVGIRIRKIYFGSELFQKYGITGDDIILEINGTPIHAETAISPLFINLVGEEIKMRIQTPRGVVSAVINGISASEQSQLRYDNMVLENTRKVTELTEGKIGYLHIQSMNQRSLRKFEQDFLAVNVNTDGLIIDVRGNGGGRISGDLVEIITRSQRAYTYSRPMGIDPEPTPRNIYQKPIVVLMDEDSYSDAEIFSSLFRDLEIGVTIGMPTSGSVIGTRPWPLLDGSSMRMPLSGWFRLNMENMELIPTTPMIRVPMLPGDIVNNNDVQLLRAIEELQTR